MAHGERRDKLECEGAALRTANDSRRVGELRGLATTPCVVVLPWGVVIGREGLRYHLCNATPDHMGEIICTGWKYFATPLASLDRKSVV